MQTFSVAACVIAGDHVGAAGSGHAVAPEGVAGAVAVEVVGELVALLAEVGRWAAGQRVV